MMRLVYDTNIIISGALWSGAPQTALKLLEAEQFKAFISEVMVDELNEVIRRDKFKTRLARIGKTPEQIVSAYLQISTIIEVAAPIRIVPDDPDDDHVLACALTAQATVIVTGAEHLLQLKQYENIDIVSVGVFLEKYAPAAKDTGHDE